MQAKQLPQVCHSRT